MLNLVCCDWMQDLCAYVSVVLVCVCDSALFLTVTIVFCFSATQDCAEAYVGPSYRGHPQSDVVLFSFGTIKVAVFPLLAVLIPCILDTVRIQLLY